MIQMIISGARKFYSYLKKDCLLLIRRRKYLYLFLALPFIIALLFLFFLNPSPGSIKTAVCDNDNTEYSKEALMQLKGFKITLLKPENCTERLVSMVKSKQYSLGIEVPKGFSNDISNLEQADLIVYYDNTDIAFSSLVEWKIDNALAPYEESIIDELNRELINRNAASDEINGLIDRIVAEELAARTAASNAEIMELSTSFADSRSKLPWPVNEGFISMGFGRQQHPVLKLVEVDNKGIYIQTQPEQEIKAVFAGKVSIVASIPGMNKAVIVQHGEYFTVYAKLKSVNVTMGQSIRENYLIGIVNTDKSGKSELQFQIWKNNKKLNPENWLARK